jgi:peptidyl-prolyl cis-trans isomerase SurA
MIGVCQPGQLPILADGIIGIVGDKIILKSEIEQEFFQMSNQPGAKLDSNVRCQILDQMLTSKLLIKQAEADSIKISEDEVEGQLDRRVRYFSQMVGGQEKLEEFYGKTISELKDDFRHNIRDQLLASKMQEKITKDATISPSEVKLYFTSIAKDSLPYFETELEVGQIVVFPKINEYQKQYSYDKLLDIKKRIEKGESFETLAILYSQDPGSAQKGGDLGFFGRGEMVSEFEATAYKLKPGELSGIIKTKYGYHLLKLDERRGERVHARHILIKPPVSNSELEKSRKLLDSVRTLIVEKKIEFPEAVKKISDDEETRVNGGMFQNPQAGNNSFFPEQLPPEVYFQIEKLNPGDYTSVIPYTAQDGKQGYRMLYLASKSKPHQCNMNDDYGKIQQAALTKKKSEQMKLWFKKARSRYYISIDPSFSNCENLKRWN